jgi:ribosomal protein S6
MVMLSSRLLYISLFWALLLTEKAQGGSTSTRSAKIRKRELAKLLPEWRRRTQEKVAATPGALSFLSVGKVEVEQPSARKHRHAQAHVHSETRVCALARCFETVFARNQNSQVDGDCCIDTKKLLEACKNYVSVLKDMGERQIAYDMQGNVRKLEALYHTSPAHRRTTISELLEFEKKTGIHKPGRLKDPSGAMGLLWIHRSLSCQHRMYGMLLENRDPQEAAVEAYKAELQQYHGWVLQKLALGKTARPRHEILAKIGGFARESFGDREEAATVNDLHQLLSTWRPILDRCTRVYAELDIEDTRRV